MECVGARFDADADDATGVVAEIGAGILGDDIELLNGIDVRHVGDFVVFLFLVDDAVEEETNGLLAVAINVGTARASH